MTPEQLLNQTKIKKHYLAPVTIVQSLEGASVSYVTFRAGSPEAVGILPRKGLIDFSKWWEGELGLCLILDGEPRSDESRTLLLDAGFGFFRADKQGRVKEATWTRRPDGSRGARGWKKADLTPDQVDQDPYSLWL